MDTPAVPRGGVALSHRKSPILVALREVLPDPGLSPVVAVQDSLAYRSHRSTRCARVATTVIRTTEFTVGGTVSVTATELCAESRSVRGWLGAGEDWWVVGYGYPTQALCSTVGGGTAPAVVAGFTLAV